jgi:hypothetical protein
MAPARDYQSDSNGAVTWRPGSLWGLGDVMIRFWIGSIGTVFAQMLELSERVSAKPSDDVVSDINRNRAFTILESAGRHIANLELVESIEAITRIEKEFGRARIKNKELELHFVNLAHLIESELNKLHAFALDRNKLKFFRDLSYGIEINPAPKGIAPPPAPLFTQRAQDSFPSAGMDIVEAGRCIALGRNNAAIYHLMQVAEVGLRALARDRRVIIVKHKGKTVVPLDYAQWGDIIDALRNKQLLIHQWRRNKPLKEQAIQYYSSLIFEVSSFNDIYRKHISHARGTVYEDDTAISCWGHVSRFMDKLAERVTETKRTHNVWTSVDLYPF